MNSGKGNHVILLFLLSFTVKFSQPRKIHSSFVEYGGSKYVVEVEENGSVWYIDPTLSPPTRISLLHDDKVTSIVLAKELVLQELKEMDR